MENQAKSKIDPGWNDPPMLNYSPSNPPPKSRIMNKRVAFPLSSGGTNSKSVQSTPVLPTSSQLPPPSKLFMPSQEDVINLTDEDLLKRTNENFEKLALVNNAQPIKESIQTVNKMWTEQKLSNECRKNIFMLSKYLVEGNVGNAQQIKEKLLLEFKESCEAWLNGLL